MRRLPFEIVGVLASLILAFAGSASSQELSPSAADLTRILNADEAAIIVTTDGRRLTGSVEGVSETTLTLRMRAGVETVLLEHLREVRVRRHDPLWDGVLIGAGTGALAGLIPDYYDDCAECHDALYGSIALGAGIGLLIDVFRPRARLVYRAPVREQAMSIGGQVGGGRARVVLRWSF